MVAFRKKAKKTGSIDLATGTKQAERTLNCLLATLKNKQTVNNLRLYQGTTARRGLLGWMGWSQ
jgi:hypothetical protein